MHAKNITISIAHEETIFRRGLLITLKKSSGITIIGEAANAAEVSKIVAEKMPDIILTDLHVYETDMLVLIANLSKQYLKTRFIILTQQQDETSIFNSIEAGTWGYLLKNVSDDELHTAIEEVYNGNMYYSKKISNKVFKLIAANGYDKAIGKIQEFSAYEQKIIQCICNEMSSKEIGKELCISDRTVEGYRCQLMKKMGVKTPIAVVKYAIKHRLFRIDPP
jgi:DNA-binding NarL/FixJ family response regulator